MAGCEISFVPALPSDEYELNVLINEIADELSSDDLKRLKTLCRGRGGTGSGVLESITDGIDFMNHLRNRGLISKDNIIALQCMTWRLKNRSIHDKLLNYARKMDKTLHFYTPTTQPENGYAYLKYHVVNTENFNREKLEDLRFRIHQYLGVPVEFILVRGLQTDRSILITFMIPEGAGDPYLTLDPDHARLLSSYGVDRVEFRDKVIQCNDDKDEMVSDNQSKMPDEMKILRQKVTDTEAHLEESEIKLLQTQKILAYRTKDVTTQQRALCYTFWWLVIMTCVNVHRIVVELSSVQRLTAKSAAVYFKHMLGITYKKGYDRDIIRLLIEANTIVMSARINRHFQNQIESLILRITELTDAMCVLKYEKDKLAFYFNIRDDAPILSKRDEFFLSQRHNTQVVRVQVSGYINNEDLEIIFPILTEKMTESEKAKIMELSLLTTEERNELKSSKANVLLYTWKKEKNRCKGPSDVGTWVSTMMTEIQRNDLLSEWLDISREATVSNPKEISVFRKDFEHSKLKEKSKNKRKSPNAKRPYSHPSRSLPGHAADASPESSGVEDMYETEEADASELLKIYQRLNSMESILARLVHTRTCDTFVPFNDKLFQQTEMPLL